MKISVNKILYHWFTKIPKNFKSKSFQVSLLWQPKLSLIMNLDFAQSFGQIFTINFDLFGLFSIIVYKDAEVDHAGFTCTMNILGLDLEYENRDIRHWDYDNDKFEEYENTI